MRHTFYSTLKKIAGASLRYLLSSDFPNTTTLHGWQAGSSNTLDTAYGGITLSDDGSSGYTSSTDHLGNTVNCASADDYDHYNTGTLTGTTSSDLSVFAWVYCEDWSTNETANLLLSYFLDGFHFSQLNIGVFDGVVFVFCTDSTSGENSDATYDTGFSGSGWHSICVTRNTSTVETKIYIDGVLKETGSAAMTFSYDFDEVIPFSLGCRTTENWCHFGTVLSDGEVAALHAVGGA